LTLITSEELRTIEKKLNFVTKYLIYMKIRIPFFIFVLICVQFVQAQNTIEESIEKLSNNWAMKSASMSVCVKDATTGKVLFEKNGDQNLTPASIVKLFSTITSLEVLGPDYKFQTRIYTNGTIDPNGVLNGDIIVRGGGDPSLGSRYTHDTEYSSTLIDEWTTAIKNKGIKTVSGRVIVDASEFGYQGAPKGWVWEDLGNYYGCSPSGIILHDNILTYDFKTSNAGKPTQLNSTQPEYPGLSFDNYVISNTSNGDNSIIYGAPFSSHRYATGYLPQNRSSFLVKGSIPDPEFNVAHSLTEALKKNGVTISGLPSAYRTIAQSENLIFNYSTLKLLHLTLGDNLLDIATQTNMRSINLFAEQLLCQIGYNQNGKGDTENSVEQLKLFWSKKLDLTTTYLQDGSGLSRSNAVNSKTMCDLLIEASKLSSFAAFKSTLPVSGESGTMKNIGRGQSFSGKIQAKSGSMTRVKSYAGYVNSDSDKMLVFSIIINDHACSNSTILKEMYPFFKAMAAY
jgi:D-alanyl-D-alanine carboxypeptidase/D-alanyl-D-alanine-endopeptidase (penicillin-binding protein 4)